MVGYLLEEMTWRQVQELVPDKTDLVFLPVGTIEAHGSSCIGTDNYIPTDIADYLRDRFDAIMAPCVHYGITKSLYGYAGSITIKPENFINYMTDIVESLADKGFRRCIIVNGHGGNNSALKQVAHQSYNRFKIKTAVVSWWMMCSDITEEVYGSPGGHAGLDETGYVMSIDPKLGDKSAYESKMAYKFVDGVDVYPIPGSVLLYDKEGRGAPDFDPKKGKELADKVKKRMGDFLEDLFDRWVDFFPEE